MNILTLHMNQLGDFLFSLGCIYEMKRKGYKISCLVREHLVDVAEMSGLFDNVFIRRKKIIDKYKLLNTIRNKKFDIAIHFSQSAEPALLSFLAKIPSRVGFSTASFSFLYTKKVNFTPPPSITNNINLVKTLGIKIEKMDYVGLLKVEKDDIEKMKTKLGIKNNQKIVTISHGTSKRRKYKQWGYRNFVELIDKLNQKFNPKILLTGTENDNYIANLISKNVKSQIENLCGRTSLKELTALFSISNLFVGIDSGSMHLASAVGCPVVGIFGKTDPSVIGPKGKDSVIIKNEDINKISPTEIIESIEKLNILEK